MALSETTLPTASAPSERAPGRTLVLVLLLMALVGVGHFNRISISVAGAEKLIPEAGIEPTRMGQVYTGFLIVYTLAMIPGGWFIDRFGARVALLVVLVGSGLGMLGTGLVGHTSATPLLLWGGLMLVRPLMGLTNAPMHPGAARLVGEFIAPRRRQFVNGLVTFAACVGISGTYVVFGGLMDRFEWTGASLLVGVATLVLALAWRLGTGTGARHRQTNATSEPLVPRQSHPREDLRAMVGLLRDRNLVLLALSYGAFGYFQYLFFYWAQYYLENILEFSTAQSRMATSALTLAMGLGMAVGGWLADHLHASARHGRALSIVPGLGLTIGAAALIVGIFSPSAPVTLACFALAMAAGGACEGPCWTIAVDLGGTRGGAAASILNTGGNAGGLLAPLLTPYISAVFGWQAGFAFASAVCFVGALLWLVIRPTPPHASATP